jgi:transcriptional regulator with XRE-family HTH domain
MPRTLPAPFPVQRRQLAALGERLRLARKRRRISAVLMAERVGVSRDTLNRVEKGDAAVSLGTYLRVLRVLGLDSDLDLLARDDVLGRKLQDMELDATARKREES